jgi:hypothetical protein
MVCERGHNSMGMKRNDPLYRDWLSIITELQLHQTVWNWELFAELSSVQFSCKPLRVDELSRTELTV